MTLTYDERRSEEEVLYDEIVLARVKRGIAFCEKHYGPNWVDHIDIRELDLRSDASCVLGQLENKLGEGADYHEACDRFWAEGSSSGPTRNGFCTPSKDYKEESWDALQACWEDVLTPRVS
ncbi:MAG TPA: hypothetical protein VNN79_05990 [Actinomycetota bacterium]|nr:hypothetical protein [Actinomycetota bacterium]